MNAPRRKHAAGFLARNRAKKRHCPSRVERSGSGQGILAAHARTLQALRERVKELNCLYSITRLSQDEDISTAELVKGIAEVVRASWQHPEGACALVAVDGAEHRTTGYSATCWVQSCPVRIGGEEAGLVEVRYLENYPDCGEGPFLKEERHLLNAVADLLGRIVEARRIKSLLRSLSSELIKAQENERQRIARDLHDKAAQDLSLIKMELESLLAGFGPLSPEASMQIGRLLQQTGAVIGEIRHLAYSLLPPALEPLGLSSAAYRLCQDFASRHGVGMDFSSEGMNPVRLDFDTQINLYRILQEALANVRKHSGARNVRVLLVASHPFVILRVEDDGQGFDTQFRSLPQSGEQGMGLVSMRERARLIGARMSIRSTPGSGTRLMVEFPVQPEDAQ